MSPMGTLLVMKPELRCLGAGNRIRVGVTPGIRQSMMLVAGLMDKEARNCSRKGAPHANKGRSQNL